MVTLTPVNVYHNMLGFTKSGNTYTPAAGIRLDRGYEHDLMGSVVGEKDCTPASAASQDPGSIHRIFGHDPLRRLISATGRESTAALVQPSWDLNVRPQDYTSTNPYSRAYEYDKLGNIILLSHTADGLQVNNFNRKFNYGSSFGSNLLEGLSIGGSTYEYKYDASGNQTNENSDRHFEWNYADKLSFYKRQAGTGNPSVWVHYFYDASGQRIKKAVNKPGGIQEITVYIDGVFEHSYVRINNNVDNNRNYNTLHILDGGSRIATLRVGNDSQDSTPALKYYVEDHLGNSSVAVQSNGNRINLEEYYPFGETSFGSFAKKRYRYNGKEKDEYTGLYEYGQRYYAPWLCRFVSVDPVAEKFPHLSSYNYASNRPETARDLEGLQADGEKETGKNGNQQSGVQALSQMGTATGVQKEDGNFWGELGNYILNGIVSTIKHIVNNPNHAGYDIGAKKAPTLEQVEAYKVDWKEVLDPYKQIENFAENAVMGPVNMYEGVANEEGAQFGQGLFQTSEAVGVLYGAKKAIPKTQGAGVLKKADNIVTKAVDFSKLTPEGSVDPLKVRFSQKSISSNFSEGGSVDGLIKGLKEGTIDPNSIPAIRLVEKDGLTFTLDNRRLYAFQKAGIDINYTKLSSIPKNQTFKFTTENQGVSVFVRP